MIFYKRFPGDYQRDTGHLSLTEHGAYTLMLDHYYAKSAALPASLDALARLCRAMTRTERSAVQAVAGEFFPVGDDGLRHNARADHEIARWQTMAEHNREAGKLGGRPRKPNTNPSGNPTETRVVTRMVTQVGTRQKPYPEPESESQNKKSPLVEMLADLRVIYPKRAGSQPWDRAASAVNARLTSGHTAAEILDGARRYAEFIRITGKEGTEFVMQAARFCGPSKHFLEPWTPPATKADARLASNIEAAREAERRLFGGDTP